ncbi:unnamed protein product [Prunus armeniaca]
MLCLKGRTDNCLKFSAHSYWICLFPIIAGNGVGPLQAVEAGDGDWSAVLAGAVDRWWLAGSGGRWWLVGVVARYGHVA